MFHLLKTILVSAGALGLAGCGQKGDLYLPTGAEAVGRASLPQTLIPGPTRGSVTATATSTTASPAASPLPATTPEPRQ